MTARVDVGALARSEIEDATAVLARAFRDNPLNRSVIRSDDPELRVRSNLHGMRALVPVAHRHAHVLVARRTAVVAGVLIATAPGGFPLPAGSLVQRFRSWLGQGWDVARRWGEVFEALAWLHPRTPHWYLGTLGVEPSEQRRGVGATLLGRWLADVDREALPAYLETDRIDNVPFYERAGFVVEGETPVLGVRVWRMLRPPRP